MKKLKIIACKFCPKSSQGYKIIKIFGSLRSYDEEVISYYCLARHNKHADAPEIPMNTYWGNEIADFCPLEDY